MKLKAYLDTVPLDKRDALAKACGTSYGHLRNVAYGLRQCAESLAVLLEGASLGEVTCEEVRDDVKWVRIADQNWPHPEGRPLVDHSQALAA